MSTIKDAKYQGNLNEFQLMLHENRWYQPHVIFCGFLNCHCIANMEKIYSHEWMSHFNGTREREMKAWRVITSDSH